MDVDKLFIFCFVISIGNIIGLVELPVLKENSIRSIDSVMWVTMNKLFCTLRPDKNIAHDKSKLKVYNLIYNHIISSMTQNNNALKVIGKVTKVSKSNMNNETKELMRVIDELLDEDVDSRAYTSVDTDVSMNDYILFFLSKLENLKHEYNVARNKSLINDNIFQDVNDDSFYNNTTEETSNKLTDDDTVLSDSDYWREEENYRRVYRGERTKIKYFPFMASVHIFNQFFCAGAIIKSDLVVTAASCIQLAYNNRFFRENPAFLSVRVGTKYTIGGESIPVLEVYFYPEYDPKNLHNNICVLRLLRKVNFKKRRVKKIAIDRIPSSLSLFDDSITILGWGARKMNNIIVNPLQNILSFAVLDVYPVDECQEVYSKEYVTRMNFCAGFFSKGGGACNHDVGGPGVVNGILMGVVSFGAPSCGSPDTPTVFTKIGYYADWIDDIMNQDVPVRSKKTTLLPPISVSVYVEPISTVKMAPLNEKSSPYIVKDPDSLRMLENSALLEDFLSSVILNKDNDDNQDIFQTTKLQAITQSNLKLRKDVSSKTQPSLNIAPSTKAYYDYGTLTPMGVVDPVDEFAEDLINSGDETNVKILNNDHDIEKDLVNVIDNKDLKKIIDNISSLEEEKLLKNTKLLDLINDRHIDGTTNNKNDSVLTLLYFSESERNQDSFKNQPNPLDEDNEYVDSEGLSIATDPFIDLTHRSENISKADDILFKTKIYKLISDAINKKISKNK